MRGALQPGRHTLRPGGYGYGRARGLPWTEGVLAQLEAIVQERLPEHLTSHVREARERAERERTEREQNRRRAQEAARNCAAA